MYELIKYAYLLAFIISAALGVLTLTLVVQPIFNLQLTLVSRIGTMAGIMVTKVLGEFK